MRSRARSHPAWPVKDLYVTFRRPIDADPDKNLQAIPRKQRAVVRKGIKEGLRAEIDRDASRHYRLYSESLRNLGTPVFARGYLDRLLQAFGDDCEVLTVAHASGPVASCLSFYFRDEVLPYYGGGSQAARQLGGNDFMYWEIMERARQRGCRVFDFGRSKRGTGAFDFKRYWGFEPEPLHYEYFLVGATELPNLSPTNPKYERMIRLWRRLPLGVTQLPGAAAGETPRMSEILFLAHRIPYPPDKGDKIRSWHFLDGLARRHTVHLGAFVDDEADWPHERTLAERCGEVCLRALPPRLATARSAMGLLNGEPLTLPYYRDRALAQWVASLAGRRSLDAVFVFSSSMAQYATAAQFAPATRRVLDLCDVDSDKWRQYAGAHKWPLSQVYAREARLLEQREREYVEGFDATLVIAETEAASVRQFAPRGASRVHVIGNGVDTTYFDPALQWDDPYPAGVQRIVFTGAMDYRANVDGVVWFVAEVLPRILRRTDRVQLAIVGARPSAEVVALGIESCPGHRTRR